MSTNNGGPRRQKPPPIYSVFAIALAGGLVIFVLIVLAKGAMWVWSL